MGTLLRAHWFPREQHDRTMTKLAFHSLPGLHRLWIGTLFCCLICLGASAAPLPLRECRLQGSDASATAGRSIEARCGEYATRENRDDPGSRELRLHVAVIPALRLKPEPDPLFVLSGGPGQSAGDFYLSMSPALARIRRDRDIVIVDQRGTGRSNRLDCEFPDQAEITSVDAQRLQALARSCIEKLPGDPRFYTTSLAVRDLDEIRAALGYETINLYGISYGTRVAQHYMRHYPQRVRAAILDGVVPAELALGPDVALEAQRALDALFARCAANESCSRRFPDLPRHFQALHARLQDQPLNLSIPDPVTGQPMTIPLNVSGAGAAIRLLSYTDETASILPLLIHQAQVARQPEALAAQYLMIKRNTDAQIAYGMHFSVVCSEDAPRWTEENVTEEALAQTYIGTTFMLGMKAVCEVWPRGPVDADFDAPMRSDVPALILSGGNDPVTPQRYGEQVAKGYSRVKHLVLDGQGHGQLPSGCIPRLAAEFILEGSASSLEDECVRHISPAPFMLSRSAPAP